MLFNDLGRIIPSDKCRVFDNAERNFYRLLTPEINYSQQHSKAVAMNILSEKTNTEEIECIHADIMNAITENQDMCNLINGVSIPFAISINDLPEDIGDQLEDFFLPLLKTTFEANNPRAWFKASLQGDNHLRSEFKIAEQTKYRQFVESVKTTTLVGYYFPTALQEYDIESQRVQLQKIPSFNQFDMCISGHIEIIYSLLMYPDLLNHPETYSPILCASSLIHSDPRMVPIFKSYGPHCEFWLLSNMMTAELTQVSEQWAGGLTLYKKLDF